MLAVILLYQQTTSYEKYWLVNELFFNFKENSEFSSIMTIILKDSLMQQSEILKNTDILNYLLGANN